MPNYKDRSVEELAKAINSADISLSSRYHAVLELKNRFTDKQSTDRDAAECVLIDGAGTVDSVLNQEIIRFLGLAGNPAIVTLLTDLVQDRKRAEFTRYRAAIALGRIGDNVVIPWMDEIYEDESQPKFIREVCDVVPERLRWILRRRKNGDPIDEHYWDGFVDSEPAFDKKLGLTVQELKSITFNESKQLFERLRALTTLRDVATSDNKTEAVDAVSAMNEAIHNPSTMVAFRAASLSMQVTHPSAVPHFLDLLYEKRTHQALRIEAVDALSFMKSYDWKVEVLKYFTQDEDEGVGQMAQLSLELEMDDQDSSIEPNL